MKDKITAITFTTFIFFMMVLNILTPDQAISYSERRPLASLPKWSVESYLSGEYMTSLQKYMTDQFIYRDNFRGLKHYFSMNGLGLKDLNDIFYGQGHIFKIEHAKEDARHNFIKYIGDLQSLFSDENKLYISIIPDKSYYYDGHPYKPNYDSIFQALNNDLDRLEVIDILNGLSLDSYYKTDPHWRQEALLPLMDIFADKMNINYYEKSELDEFILEGFKGAYYGQGPLQNTEEELIYLQHEDFKDITIKNYEKVNQAGFLYDLEAFSSVDPYEFFLGGGSPLIEIENPNSDSQDQLIIFRDSFASSISPLFLKHYNKVTLIDTRYMPKDQIKTYVDISDQDVLFLYSSLVVYNSYSLK